MACACYSNPNRGSKWTHKSPKRQCFFAKKMFFLKLLFRDKGHLYTNYLFYILTFTAIAFFFSFLMLWHTYAHSHLNTDSNWTHESPKQQSNFAKQMYLLSLISKTKFTCIPIAYFIFFLFAINGFFFSS